MRQIRTILEQAQAFEQEAHAILSRHESSKSRVVVLEETFAQLAGLSLKQDELFREALHCVQHGLYRAAHVVAWAAGIDFLEEKLASDGFAKLYVARPKWKFTSLVDLREEHSDHAIIEASRETGLCTKNEMKSLHGLLSKRNECAHPSGYAPGLNEALGYISELFKRIESLQAKPY